MVFAQQTSASVLQGVTYPLTLNFKVIAFSPQVFVRNASGQEILFIHQKALKLKEDIAVYTDSKKTTQVFAIKADRIIDFSANYNFTDAAGNKIGSIKREGMRSIFKASYNLLDEAGNIIGNLKEDNAWIKVMDALLGELPVIGMFSGYFFNPSYTLSVNNVPVLSIKKQPAFLEGKFTIERLAPAANGVEEARQLLGATMSILLERIRG